MEVMKIRPTNFVTLWLKKGDDETAIKKYGDTMKEVMTAYCGGIIGDVRVAKNKRRITATTLCKNQKCAKPVSTMKKITGEITRKTNRTTKGIALCGKS
jgi:hypothetical protein